MEAMSRHTPSARLLKTVKCAQDCTLAVSVEADPQMFFVTG